MPNLSESGRSSNRRGILRAAANAAVDGSHVTAKLWRDSTSISLKPDNNGFSCPKSLFDFRTTPPSPFVPSQAGQFFCSISRIERFGDVVQRFVLHKAEFERQLVAGRPETAQEVLDSLIKNVGMSIWAVEAGIAAADRRGGLEAIRRLQNELYSKSSNISRDVLFFVYWMSRRAEPATSASSYDEAITEILADAARLGPKLRQPIAYVSLRLNIHRSTDFSSSAYLLWRESQFAVIDEYLAMLRALRVLICSGQWDTLAQIIPAISRRLAPLISDPHLRVLILLGDPSCVEFPDADLRDMSTFDAYTRGDYRTCMSEAAEQLQQRCTALSLYELHAKASIACAAGRCNPLSPGSLAFTLYERIYDVLDKDGRASESLQWLLKQSYIHDGMSLGPQLTAFCAQVLGVSMPFSPMSLAASAASAISPRMAEAMSPERAEPFLSGILRHCPGSISALMFRDIAAGRANTPGLPAERAQKCQARRLEHAREWGAAALAYRQLGLLAGQRATYAEDAATGLYRCLLAAGAIHECVQHVVETYLRRQGLLMSVRLSSLFDRLRADEAARPVGCIDWPIACQIYYREVEVARDVYQVFVAYDDFLSAHELDRPSQLGPISERFDRQKLIFFLRFVCVREVMRNAVLAFASAAAVDAERIAVCNILRTLDSQNSEAIEREIVELTTQLVIRRAMVDVGERRVHVDIRGIRESLRPQLRENFERYVANSELTDAVLRKVVTERGLPVAPGLRLVNSDTRDEAYQVFLELFSELRSQFLFSSMHGLDFFLSVRIRHGALEGQIGRRFQTAHLFNTRIQPGSYERNTFWAQHFASCGEQTVTAVDAVLQKFSEKVDALIDEVRGTWIQIRGKSNDQKGLLDFDFTEAEQFMLHVKAQKLLVEPETAGLSRFDAFIDLLFSSLWDRTEGELEKLRAKFGHELKDRFVALFDELEYCVRDVLTREDAYFSSMVTSCRTAIQDELDIITRWFTIVDERAIQDFDFSLAVNTGIEITRSLNPTCSFEPKVNIESAIRCSGSTLVHLVYIVQILLQNVVKHSRSSSPEVFISVRCIGEYLELIVRNQLPTSVDIAALTARLALLRTEAVGGETAATVTGAREGGTGLLKIRRLLRGGLQCTDFDVHFGVDSDHEFTARVRLSLEGIRNEDTISRG